MRKVTLKGLLAHKLRLALTALAIVLGVTFTSGTFVLTDTLHDTFTTLFTGAYQNMDFQVQGVTQLGSGAGATRADLPQSLVATVRGVPGVAAAEGEVTCYAQFVAKDGKPIKNGTAQTLGLSFDPDQGLSSLRIASGTGPKADDDVVMDAATADKYGFGVGQQVRIATAKGPHAFTISGIAKFGTAGNLAGTTIAAFTLSTAQAIADKTGKLNTIRVRVTPGADKATVQQAIAEALPAGAEVVTRKTVVDENAQAVDQALAFFSNALLVFAFISLFVGAFTIYNTFSIIVGQRTRELALLRIVGASRRQVFGSVLLEAALTGFVSSVIGIGLGVLTAIGLQALLKVFGVTLPPGSLVFAPRTVLVGLAVGIGFTVISAIPPARNAVRIPPVVALDDRRATGGGSLRTRVIGGSALTLVGAALLAAGLVRSAVELVGVAAICVFLGVTTLSATVARPMSSVIGRPLQRLLGESGKLGRVNAMRTPRRTAQTAAALTIGLALVAAVAVFGASVSRSTTSSADQAINADLLVTGSDSAPVSDEVAAAAKAVPGVGTTTVVYSGQFAIQDSLVSLAAVSTDHLADTLILRMDSGSADALDRGGLLIDSTTARTEHLSVGDTIHARFARTGETDLQVGGVFKANALIGSYLGSAELFRQHFGDQSPVGLLLRTDGTAATQTAVTRAMEPFLNIVVQSRDDFEKAQTASVNQLLGLVYALLGLAVLIALIGIVNTLMLSVFERTREIGLLRAVGMRRRQVRAMIRSEAVILAIFGAVIGIVIGTGMGVALVSSLKQQGITDIVVPIPELVIFLVVAAVLGLIAATWPSRRAAKLDVLTAIATR